MSDDASTLPTMNCVAARNPITHGSSCALADLHDNISVNVLANRCEEEMPLRCPFEIPRIISKEAETTTPKSFDHRILH